MITIKDIAKEAGVSHGTVSNVLNKTGKVSSEKIMLVENAVKKLGYVRNSQAKQLRQGFKKSIALIIPNLEVPQYTELFSFFKDQFTNEDYEIKLYTTNDVPIIEKNFLEEINLSKVDAIIAISCLDDTTSIYKNTCPTFFIDRLPLNDNINKTFVSFDFKKIGKDISEYVKNKDLKNIAYFSNPLTFKNDSDLFTSLKNNLNSHDILIKNFSCDYKLSSSKSFDLFINDFDFDAIITSDAKRANDALAASNFTRSYKVPEIIAIDTLKIFTSNKFVSYHLNYKLLAQIITTELLNYFESKKFEEKNIILKSDGFRFRFVNANKSSNTTLNMLALTSPSSLALKKLLPSFKKATGIDVKLDTLEMDDLYEYLTLAKDNNFYDIIRMDVAWMSKLASSVYMPLEDTNKDFSPIFSNLIENTQVKYSFIGDKQYSIPFDPSILVLLYRKDFFEDATLKRRYYEMFSSELTIPKTFEQFNKVASFFTKSKNPNSPTKFGATVPFGKSAVVACDFIPRLLSISGSILTNDRIVINTPKSIDALNNYIETYQYSSQKPNSWWSSNIDEFNNGLTAMTTVFSNHVSNIINNQYSNFIGKVGFSKIPGEHSILGGGVIGISKYCTKIDECYEFFKWFYSSEISSAFTLLGGLSPHKDIYVNHDILSLFPWIKESNSYFSTASRNIIPDDSFDQRKFENILGNSIKNALLGTLSPKESLDYAQILIDANFKF